MTPEITDHPAWSRYERLLKIEDLWAEMAKVSLIRRYALKRQFRAAGAAARLHREMADDVYAMRRTDADARRELWFVVESYLRSAGWSPGGIPERTRVDDATDAIARRIGASFETIRPHVAYYFEAWST